MFERDLTLTEASADGEWHPKHIDIVACLFITANIATWVTAIKLWTIGPMTFSAATLVYPLTCIFGDVLTEIYGFNRTRRLIWTGFICGLIFMFFLQLAIILPPAPDFHLQDAFATINGALPRVVIASYVAYICCEFTNSTVISKMKVRSGGDNFPLRAALSTILAQFVDSVVFFVAAFAGTVPPMIVLSLVLSTWIAKSLYEIIFLPVTTIAVAKLKRLEGIEHFDRHKLQMFKF
ncbi:MAG TPA: queuosine precursor transporter [Alphaproteobacteria bacterium]|nr:queuosine precursor transporter [Alphaproteobacteria bacterium]